MEPVFAHRGEMTLGWILVVTTIIRTTKDKETTSMISNQNQINLSLFDLSNKFGII